MKLWPPILMTLASGRIGRTGCASVSASNASSVREPWTRAAPSSVRIWSCTIAPSNTMPSPLATAGGHYRWRSVPGYVSGRSRSPSSARAQSRSSSRISRRVTGSTATEPMRESDSQPAMTSAGVVSPHPFGHHSAAHRFTARDQTALDDAACSLSAPRGPTPACRRSSRRRRRSRSLMPSPSRSTLPSISQPPGRQTRSVSLATCSASSRWITREANTTEAADRQAAIPGGIGQEQRCSVLAEPWPETARASQPSYRGQGSEPAGARDACQSRLCRRQAPPPDPRSATPAQAMIAAPRQRRPTREAPPARHSACACSSNVFAERAMSGRLFLRFRQGP